MINYQDFMNNGQSQMPPMMDSVRDELGNTLRSVRDTLAISFQTLNLTLSSINNTMRSISSNMATSSIGGFMGRRDPSMIPAGVHPSSFLGSMSSPMAQAIGGASTLDLMTMRKPFNVSPYEWAQQSERELGYRGMGFGTDMAIGVAGLGVAAAAYRPIENRVFRAADRMGPRVGGAFRSMPGRLATGFGVMAGVDMALSPITGAMGEAADGYIQDVSAFRRMSPRFSSEFSLQQSQQEAKGIRGLAYNELMHSGFNDSKLGLDGYRAVAMQGMQMNLFQGNSPDELVSQVEKAAKVVKFLTGVMGNKDVTETMATLGQLKTMGVNGVKDMDYIMKLGKDAFAKGRSMGVQPGQLLNQSIQAASGIYGQYGLPSFGGVAPMMQNISLVHALEKSRFFSAGEIAAGGGHQGIARSYAGSMASMMANPQIGGVMLAAGMTPGGHFNQGMFNQAMQGNGMGLVNSGAMNLLGGGPFAMMKYRMNSTRMQEEMMKNGGGERMMEMAMKKYMDMMPLAGQGSYEDKQAFYATQFMQMTGNNDPMAAKLFAMKAMNPNFTNTSGEANAIRGANNARFRSNHSPLAPYRRAAEGIARIPGMIKYGIDKAVQPVADWFGIQLDGEGDSVNGGLNAGDLGPYAGRNMAALRASMPDKFIGRDPKSLTRGEIAGLESEDRIHGTEAESDNFFGRTIYENARKGYEALTTNGEDYSRGQAMHHAADKWYYKYGEGAKGTYAEALNRGDYKEFYNKIDGDKGAEGFEKDFKEFTSKNSDYMSKAGLKFLTAKRKDAILSAASGYQNKVGDDGTLGGVSYAADKAAMQRNLGEGKYKAAAKAAGMSEFEYAHAQINQKWKGNSEYENDVESKLGIAGKIGKDTLDLSVLLDKSINKEGFEKGSQDASVEISEQKDAYDKVKGYGVDVGQLSKGISDAKDPQKMLEDIDNIAKAMSEGKGNSNLVIQSESLKFMNQELADGKYADAKGKDPAELAKQLKQAAMRKYSEGIADSMANVEGISKETSMSVSDEITKGNYSGAYDALAADNKGRGDHNAMMKEVLQYGKGGFDGKSAEDVKKFIFDKTGKDLSDVQGSAKEVYDVGLSRAMQADQTEAGQKDMADKEKMSYYADGNAIRVKMESPIDKIREFWNDNKPGKK